MSSDGFYDIQYKANAGQVNLDQAQGIVECFVAGIGNKDSVGDVCASGAFTKSLMRRKPRVVWGHNWNDPIGKVLEIYEVPPNDPRLPGKMKSAGIGGLYARVQFNLNSEKGREAFANVAFFGEEQEWSIGYKTIKAQFDQQNQANILYEVELYEVSPVLHGANQLTGTISVKNAEKGGAAVMPMPSSPSDMPEEDIQRKLQEQLSAQLGGKVKVSAVSDNHVMFTREGDEENMYKCRFHHEDGAFMFGQPQRIVMPMAMPQAPKPQQMPQMPMGMPSKPIQPVATGQTVVVPAALPGGNPQQQPLVRISYSEDGSPKKPEGKPKLVQEEADLADALIKITKRHGKFNEDSTGVWAGYKSAAENPVAKIGVKCSNCVMYEGKGSCKIIDKKVEDGGKCRFAIIPEGVVQVTPIKKQELAEEKEKEEVKWLSDIEAKFPEEFLNGDLRMALKRKREAQSQFIKMVPINKFESKSLESNTYFYVPVATEHAFEVKQAIDPIIDFYRADAYVEDGGIVFTSGVNKDFAEAIDTAVKALGRNLAGKLRSGGRGLSARFNPNAWDGDNDGIVQEGTPFQRPAIPGVNDFSTRGKVNKRKARQAWEQYQREGKPKVQKKPSSQAPRPSAPKPARGEDLTPSAPRPGAGSGRKRSLTRHSNRDPKFEAQMPDRAENAKRESHEALIQAWEQGMGMPFTPIERQVGEKGPRFTEDWLRGRELGYNDAKARWMGKGTSKRPSTFKENQKSSVDYANWFMNVVGQLGMDKRDRDRRGAQSNYDNEGIDAGIKTFLMENAPTPQSDELQKRINDTLKDAGFERGKGLSSGGENRTPPDKRPNLLAQEIARRARERSPQQIRANQARAREKEIQDREEFSGLASEINKRFNELTGSESGVLGMAYSPTPNMERIRNFIRETKKTGDVVGPLSRNLEDLYAFDRSKRKAALRRIFRVADNEKLVDALRRNHADYAADQFGDEEGKFDDWNAYLSEGDPFYLDVREAVANELGVDDSERDNDEVYEAISDMSPEEYSSYIPEERLIEVEANKRAQRIQRRLDAYSVAQELGLDNDSEASIRDAAKRIGLSPRERADLERMQDNEEQSARDMDRGLSSGRRRTPTTEELESTLGMKLSRLVMPARLELEESRRKKARTLNQDEVGFSGEFIDEDYPLNYRGRGSFGRNDPRDLEEITYTTNGEYSVASPSKFIGNTVVFSDGRRGVITSSLEEPYAVNDADFDEDEGLIPRVAFAPGEAEIMITHDKDGTLLKSPERFVGSFDGTADNGLDIEEYFEPDRWPNRFAIEDNKISQETVDDLKKAGGSRRGLSSGYNLPDGVRERDLPGYYDKDPDPDATNEFEWQNIPKDAQTEIIKDFEEYVQKRGKASKDNIFVTEIDEDYDIDGATIVKEDGVSYVARPHTSPRELFTQTIDNRGRKQLLDSMGAWESRIDKIRDDGGITDSEAEAIKNEIEKIKSLINNPTDESRKELSSAINKIEEISKNARDREYQRGVDHYRRTGEELKNDKWRAIVFATAENDATEKLRQIRIDLLQNTYTGKLSKDGKYEITPVDEFVQDIINGGELDYNVEYDPETGDYTTVSDPRYIWKDFAKFRDRSTSSSNRRGLSSGRSGERGIDYRQGDPATVGRDMERLSQRSDDLGANYRYLRELDSQDSAKFMYGGRMREIWAEDGSRFSRSMKVSKDGAVYFVGFDPDAEGYRSFRLDKIEGLIQGADYEGYSAGWTPEGFTDPLPRALSGVSSGRNLRPIEPFDEIDNETYDEYIKRAVDQLNEDGSIPQGILSGDDGTVYEYDPVTRLAEDMYYADQEESRQDYLRSVGEDRTSGLSSGRRFPADSGDWDDDLDPEDRARQMGREWMGSRSGSRSRNPYAEERRARRTARSQSPRSSGGLSSGATVDKARNQALQDDQLRELFKESGDYDAEFSYWVDSLPERKRRTATEQQWERTTAYADALLSYENRLADQADRIADRRTMGLSSGKMSFDPNKDLTKEDKDSIFKAINDAIGAEKPKLQWRDINEMRKSMSDDEIARSELDKLQKAYETRREILDAFGVSESVDLPRSGNRDVIDAVYELDDFIDDRDSFFSNEADRLSDLNDREEETLKSIDDLERELKDLSREKMEMGDSFDPEIDDFGSEEEFNSRVSQINSREEEIRKELDDLETEYRIIDQDKDEASIFGRQEYSSRVMDLYMEDRDRPRGAPRGLSSGATPREQRRAGLSSGRRDLTDDEIEARNEYMREGMLDQEQRAEDDFIRAFGKETVRDRAKIAVAYRKETGKSADPKSPRFRRFAEEMIDAKRENEDQAFELERENSRGGLSSGARSSGRISKVADQMFDDYVSEGRIDSSTEELADKYGVSDLVAERARRRAEEYIEEANSGRAEWYASLPEPTDEELQAMADDYERRGLSSGRDDRLPAMPFEMSDWLDLSDEEIQDWMDENELGVGDEDYARELWEDRELKLKNDMTDSMLEELEELAKETGEYPYYIEETIKNHLSADIADYARARRDIDSEKRYLNSKGTGLSSGRNRKKG